MQFQPTFTALVLRAWWPVVVVLAVVGFGVGMYSVGVASYSATSLLRVDVSTNPLQSKEIISTAQVLVDSDPVYFRATNETREAADALRDRTSVGVVNDGEIIKVTIVAPTAPAAIAQTNRFADAAVEQARALAVDQFQRVTQLAQDSLKNGALADPDSEKQRREHVGQNLADAQSAASRSSDLLTRIGGVQAPVAIGLPPRLAGPLGALIGALLGFVVCLLLGVRHWRIRRPTDLKVMDPRLRVYGPGELDNALLRVAARCATLDRPLVAVLALPAAEDSLPEILERFDRQLRNEHLHKVDVDAADLGRGTAAVDLARPLRPGREGLALPARSDRGSLLSAAEADVIVVSGSASHRVAQEAGARAEAVIVVGRLQATRLKEFFTLYPEISDASPMVLLVAPNPRNSSGMEDDHEGAGADQPPAESVSDSVPGMPPASIDRVTVPVSVSSSAITAVTKNNGSVRGNGNGDGATSGGNASADSDGAPNGTANGNSNAPINGNAAANGTGDVRGAGYGRGDGTGSGSSTTADIVNATADSGSAATVGRTTDSLAPDDGATAACNTNPGGGGNGSSTAAVDNGSATASVSSNSGATEGRPKPSPRPRPTGKPGTLPETAAPRLTASPVDGTEARDD